MIRTLSQTEIARRDTLITRASAGAFDHLAQFYGLVRPSSYPVEAWRDVLRAVAYQPRGTFRVLFGALDALFSPWRDSVQLTANIDASGSFTHPSLTSTAYAHRWIKIGNAVYWVAEVDTGTTTAQITPHASAYWDAWTTAQSNAEISFLPFFIVEGSAEISIYLDIEILAVPPTYLQPAGQARPATQPDGGHLLNLLDLDPATLDYGDQNIGPYPLYLFSGDEADGILGDLLRVIIPAGVKYALYGAQWGGALGYPPISSLERQGSV